MWYELSRSVKVFLWVLVALLGAAPAQAAAGDEPARRLSPEGVRNLEAFTRLLGYVRFFHPSDQAAAADWHQVAIAGVQSIEGAGDAAELARGLEEHFRPLAPTLRVYVEGNRPPVPAELLPPPGVPDPEVTFWFHTGVRLPTSGPGPYISRRLVFPGAPPVDTGLGLPGEPLEVSLGRGVSALLPVTLYRDAQGTIPRAATLAPVPDKPAGWTPSGNDRATRLAGVALAWPVLQHFYPYFDVVQADWPAELRKALLSAAEDADERSFVETLRRFMASIDDGHARVDHASRRIDHQIPLVWEWIDNQLVVTHAEAPGAAGLAPGDIVLMIDGRPARQVFEEEMDLAPGATPQHLRSRALEVMLLGEPDEEVRLRVLRRQGGAEEVTVRRSRPIPGGTSGIFLTEPRPEKVAEIRPGIFYLDVNRITLDDFDAVADRLATARGVIFDFRGYPWLLDPDFLGNFTDVPIRTAFFDIPISFLPDRRTGLVRPGGWFLGPRLPRVRARTAFLTEGGSISYAETLMAFVEAYGLGEIVGEATAGTNGNVNFIALPGGYSLRFTGMQVIKHDGTRHHGVGILPTVPVARTLDGVREGRDELLEKALEVVNR